MLLPLLETGLYVSVFGPMMCKTTHLACKRLQSSGDTLTAHERGPVHLVAASGTRRDHVLVGDVDRGHGDIVRVGQLANVVGIRHTACKVEAASGVKLVLGDTLRVAHEGGGSVLVTDELDELVGTDTSLVSEGEALGEELDEAELERVADEPCASAGTPPPP